MKQFLVLAAASILVGLLFGATIVIGVTHAAEKRTEPAFTRNGVQQSVLNEVEYGDRCYHGHCVPRHIPRCWHGHCVD